MVRMPERAERQVCAAGHPCDRGVYQVVRVVIRVQGARSGVLQDHFHVLGALPRTNIVRRRSSGLSGPCRRPGTETPNVRCRSNRARSADGAPVTRRAGVISTQPKLTLDSPSAGVADIPEAPRIPFRPTPAWAWEGRWNAYSWELRLRVGGSRDPMIRHTQQTQDADFRTSISILGRRLRWSTSRFESPGTAAWPPYPRPLHPSSAVNAITAVLQDETSTCCGASPPQRLGDRRIRAFWTAVASDQGTETSRRPSPEQSVTLMGTGPPAAE